MSNKNSGSGSGSSKYISEGTTDEDNNITTSSSSSSSSRSSPSNTPTSTPPSNKLGTSNILNSIRNVSTANQLKNNILDGFANITSSPTSTTLNNQRRPNNYTTTTTTTNIAKPTPSKSKKRVTQSENDNKSNKRIRKDSNNNNNNNNSSSSSSNGDDENDNLSTVGSTSSEGDQETDEDIVTDEQDNDSSFDVPTPYKPTSKTLIPTPSKKPAATRSPHKPAAKSPRKPEAAKSPRKSFAKLPATSKSSPIKSILTPTRGKVKPAPKTPKTPATSKPSATSKSPGTPKRRRNRVRIELHKYRRVVSFLIPKLPFSRLVKEILHTFNDTYRITAESLLALHCMAETYLTNLFEDSNVCANHARRVTINARDVRLVNRLRNEDKMVSAV